MKRAMVIAILASLALAGCGSSGDSVTPQATQAAPTVAPTMPSTIIDPAATAALLTFEGRDSNHDGFVSEVEDATAAAKVFDAIDVDQDGAVTAQEYTAARIALGLTSLPGSAELIAGADQDGDGQLTLAEWIASESKAFAFADKDGNGKLDLSEWDAMPRLVGARVEGPKAIIPAPYVTEPAEKR